MNWCRNRATPVSRNAFFLSNSPISLVGLWLTNIFVCLPKLDAFIPYLFFHPHRPSVIPFSPLHNCSKVFSAYMVESLPNKYLGKMILIPYNLALHIVTQTYDNVNNIYLQISEQVLFYTLNIFHHWSSVVSGTEVQRIWGPSKWEYTTCFSWFSTSFEGSKLHKNSNHQKCKQQRQEFINQ